MKLIISKPEVPATLHEIDEFETKFNISLPKDYKEFLLENNGGDAKFMLFPNKTTYWEGGISIDRFFSLNEIEESLKNIESYEDWEPIVECMKKGSLIIAMEGLTNVSIGIKDFNFNSIFVSNYTEGLDIEIISSSFDEFINGFEEPD